MHPYTVTYDLNGYTTLGVNIGEYERAPCSGRRLYTAMPKSGRLTILGAAIAFVASTGYTCSNHRQYPSIRST